MQELNREGQRRWRAKHPDQHRANQREHKRRKKLEPEEGCVKKPVILEGRERRG
jgi:hypothetical protein